MRGVKIEIKNTIIHTTQKMDDPPQTEVYSIIKQNEQDALLQELKKQMSLLQIRIINIEQALNDVNIEVQPPPPPKLTRQWAECLESP